MTYNITKRFSESEWNILSPDEVKDFMINELMAGIRKEVTKYASIEQKWDGAEPGITVTASIYMNVGPELKRPNLDYAYDKGTLDTHKLLKKQLDELHIDNLKRDLGYDFDEPFPNLNKFVADKQAEAFANSFNPGRINNASLDSLLNSVQVHQDFETDTYWIRGEDEMIDVTELVKDLQRRKGNGF
ncbi:TPA: hypothetical protein SIF56_004479 [Escherichia coli]|nr:hypothetical protein [Escherichia coli]